VRCGCGCFEVVVDSDRFATTTFSECWDCGCECVEVVVVAVVSCDDYFVVWAEAWNLLCVIKLRLEQLLTMMFVFWGLFCLMQHFLALFGSAR
jgi:hypothetical protein